MLGSYFRLESMHVRIISGKGWLKASNDLFCRWDRQRKIKSSGFLRNVSAVAKGSLATIHVQTQTGTETRPENT